METSIFITELVSGLKLHARCHDTKKSAAVKVENVSVLRVCP